jgi:hypothetical protein
LPIKVIADCQLPIADWLSLMNSASMETMCLHQTPIGNRQLAIGNNLIGNRQSESSSSRKLKENGALLSRQGAA